MSKDLKFMPRALGARFVGLPADNQLIGCTSAARTLMVSRQKEQVMSLIHPDIASMQSCLEKDIHYHTMKVQIPVDAEILDVIPIVPENPWRQIVFYRCIKTGFLGHVDLRKCYTGDGKYGFEYQPTPDLQTALSGTGFIAGGTPLLEPPSSLYSGEYNYGIELQTVICSMPETAEDGIKVSQSALKRMAFNRVIKRQIHVGYNQEPISMGVINGQEYLVPVPGMKVRDDGVIMAVRQIDSLTGTVLSHKQHLSRVNHDLDTVYQINGDGGNVVDIWVMKATSQSHVLHNPQLDYLADLCLDYQRNFIAAYRRLRHVTKGIFPETESFLTNAILEAEHSKSNREALGLNINKVPLPPYVVDITISQLCYPDMAAKLSDKFSAKSVIVHIEEDENMPVDMYGVRAELVVPREAGTNRNIIGRDYMQLISGCIHTCTAILLQLSGLQQKCSSYKAAERVVRNLQHDVKEAMLDTLRELYVLINTAQATSLDKYRHDSDEMFLLLVDSIHRGVVVAVSLDVISSGNNNTSDHALPLGPIPIIHALMASKFYRAPGPIKYVLYDGSPIETVNNITIAPIYYNLLDKLGQDSTATYSTYRQVRGLTALQTKYKKDTSPVSRSNIKVLGNDECIVLSGVVGPVAMAKHIRDLSDPRYNAIYVQHVLNSGELYPDIPTSVCPVGQNVGRKLIMHVLNAAGIELYMQ